MSASSSAFSQKAPLDAVFHCPTGPEPTAIRFSDVPPVRFAFHHLPGTAVWNLAFFPIEKQEGRNAMAAPDRFIAWCKQEQASIEQQLELMARKVRTGEDIGAGWIDTTADSIQRARARLAELKSLLTESGSATVSKPESRS